jgi:serine/threonine-protein kinase HipA
MLGARDGEIHSYMEIADVLRQHGAAPQEDMRALWRRLVFNILVSNTDDHLRNHAFLYVGKAGWRLSPAYDLNPVPLDLKPRVLSTAIGYDDDTSASLDRAFEVADYFEVGAPEAKGIAVEVARVVRRWRRVAAGIGLAQPQIERLDSAFEHEDLGRALRGG